MTDFLRMGFPTLQNKRCTIVIYDFWTIELSITQSFVQFFVRQVCRKATLEFSKPKKMAEHFIGWQQILVCPEIFLLN